MLVKVGELARRSGLTVRALHHYDSIGSLHPTGRSDSGYRLYSRDDVARLHGTRPCAPWVCRWPMWRSCLTAALSRYRPFLRARSACWISRLLRLRHCVRGSPSCDSVAAGGACQVHQRGRAAASGQDAGAGVARAQRTRRALDRRQCATAWRKRPPVGQRLAEPGGPFCAARRRLARKAACGLRQRAAASGRGGLHARSTGLRAAGGPCPNVTALDPHVA